MGKKPRSFSIDEDIAEVLSNREDLNPSGMVNEFLREFVSNGRGEEAALEVRISQLDEDIHDLEKQLERKRRERDRIESQLESRRSNLYEVAEQVEAMIDAGDFPRANVDPDNAAIQNYANDAGVPAEEFVEELEGRL